MPDRKKKENFKVPAVVMESAVKMYDGKKNPKFWLKDGEGVKWFIDGRVIAEYFREEFANNILRCQG